MDLDNTVWPQITGAFRSAAGWAGNHYAGWSTQTQQWTMFGLGFFGAIIVLRKTTDGVPVLRNPLVRLLAAGAVGLWASGQSRDVERYFSDAPRVESARQLAAHDDVAVPVVRAPKALTPG